MMDALQEMVDTEAIKRLKARYFYYLDTRDWAAWLALFIPDATFEWDRAVSTGGRDGETVEKCVGLDEMRRRLIDEALDGATTVHHGHMPILEIVSDTEARGIWAMEDLIAGPGRDSHGYGHYHETYRKVDGEWKIATVHLTRLRRTYTLL
jgi:hypothetical protein